MAIIETVTTHAQATRGTMYMIGTATYIKNERGAITKISSGLRINSAKDEAAGIRILDTDFVADVAQIISIKTAQVQAQIIAQIQAQATITDSIQDQITAQVPAQTPAQITVQIIAQVPALITAQVPALIAASTLTSAQITDLIIALTPAQITDLIIASTLTSEQIADLIQDNIAQAPIFQPIVDNITVSNINVSSGIVSLSVGESDGLGKFALGTGIVGKYLTIILIIALRNITAKITGNIIGITTVTLNEPGATVTLLYTNQGWVVTSSNTLTTVSDYTHYGR